LLLIVAILEGEAVPKKLTILAAVLVLVLSMSAPALAQQPGEIPLQDEVPACELYDACRNTSADHQYEPEGDAFSVTPASDIDQATFAPSENGNGVRYGAAQSCDGECAERVVAAARDAMGVEDSDDGTDPADTFSAAMDAALSPGSSPGSGDAAASEQAEVPVQGSEAAAYRAAFETAKEAGLDDVAAKDAAEVAVTEARKTRKGGSPSEGIAATEGKTSKAGKDRASTEAAQGKDREDKESREDKTREDDTATATASEEDVTEDADDGVVTSGEDGGTGDEDVATTPAGSKAPLLLGGVALLSVGGYAALRFVRSRPPVQGRRLLRN
jgi:hypothetical protein